MRPVTLVLLFCFPILGSEEERTRAIALYQQTEYRNSLRVLESNPKHEAVDDFLAGKNYYMLREYKKSIGSLEKAVAQDANNAEYVLWLGRAYGRRAETSWLFAMPNASKARQCFERAVALNPHYHEALNDLFEFYLNAPSIVGGGLDKARALAERAKADRPAEYEYEEAQLADKRKEYAAVEAHYRRAMELAPAEPGRYMDLARYLAKRGSLEESDALFVQAAKIAPSDPRIAFERAQIYIENQRNLPEARNLLRQYLGFKVTPDDPPKQTAEELLREATQN
jgi:tetratricopeptide (TPR) repeat protein